MCENLALPDDFQTKNQNITSSWPGYENTTSYHGDLAS